MTTKADTPTYILTRKQHVSMNEMILATSTGCEAYSVAASRHLHQERRKNDTVLFSTSELV